MEEDRTRGLLQGLKLNADEVVVLKESEEDTKNRLAATQREADDLEGYLKVQLDTFQNRLHAKHAERLTRHETEIAEERQRLNDDLALLAKQAEEAKQRTEQLSTELSTMKDKLNPETIAADIASQELRIREEFTEKSEAIGNTNSTLKTAVTNLRQVAEEVSRTHEQAREAANAIINQYNETRDNFVKTVDRSRMEIEFRYGQMMETLQANFKKLQRNWEQEKLEKESWIQQRLEEIERLKRSREQKQAQLEAETNFQLTRIRQQADAEYSAIENKLRESLKAESDKLTTQLQDERNQMIAFERSLFAANRAEKKAREQEASDEIAKCKLEIENLRHEITACQKAILGRLKWTCPECDTLEVEQKDLKTEILSLVQKMHDSEKEDANRVYVLGHVGKSNHALPRLQLPTKLGDTL
jgi:chromosome segregation ATPase